MARKSAAVVPTLKNTMKGAAQLTEAQVDKLGNKIDQVAGETEVQVVYREYATQKVIMEQAEKLFKQAEGVLKGLVPEMATVDGVLHVATGGEATRWNEYITKLIETYVPKTKQDEARVMVDSCKTAFTKHRFEPAS